MKIFLYCVDALEYNFIKDRNFPYLKQYKYYKVEIPENCLTELDDGSLKPFTPVIWKCILTGRNESESRDSKPQRYDNSTLNWLISHKFVREMWRWVLRTGFVRRGLPERIGFSRKNILEGVESIFSDIERLVVQTNPVTAEVKWAGIGQKLKPHEIVRKFEEIFEDEKREALEKINEDWEMYLFYTKILDVAGHLFWRKEDIIEQYYKKVEDFAHNLREALANDVALVIMSDHGMMEIEGSKIGGDHSHHAYASFDRPVESRDTITILDIRRIIESIMEIDA